MTKFDFPRISDDLIKQWLQEDIGNGDITTNGTVNPEIKSKAKMMVKESDGVIFCGLPIIQHLIKVFDPQVSITKSVNEGDLVHNKELAVIFTGSAASLLTLERVMLNLVQRMTAIATQTKQCVEIVQREAKRKSIKPPCLLDTRKTTPGLRALEKYAVRVGGGSNHRFGLFDGVLVKENHILAAGGISTALNRLKSRIAHNLMIEVEVTTLKEALEAIEAGAQGLLMDNFFT